MNSGSFYSQYPDASPKERGKAVLSQIGKERAIEALRWMVLIRQFELRGEAAYQQGKVGGFYHAYSGEEAIQTAAVQAFGRDNWYVDFYRCHALALLLGATPNELMSELYGKANGNAKGRGGSMHLYTDRLLGGFGIVGGHLPIATGAAFSLKYLNKTDEAAICFFGEGAVAQGAVHESLNLASLWNLPVIFIIENNQWGMGTHVSRALATHEKIAEAMAPAYQMKGYTLNGMDYFNCYEGFSHIYQETLSTQRPVLVECVCERFRGHSISDPGLYRTKEALQKVMEQDPIHFLRICLEEEGLLDEESYKAMEKETKQEVLAAMQHADKSPWPSPATLEEGVYAS
ncbi:MAG: Acetoin:2,6-dichlorophenolindophenol oxidoreductase subunit alpha [Chlamydiae bacterium]|nr:Acetoin:2,6-dichlorophenolindophenol oxidoreductase subunit alpha [Chlamydiota bacterium]